MRAAISNNRLTSRVGFAQQRSLIKSIQRGTITIGPAATTNTAAIVVSDINNCDLRCLGTSCSGIGSFPDCFGYVVLTNATTVTAVRGNSGGTAIVSFEVIEYHPGVIKSRQAGVILMAAVVSNTAVPTLVDTTKANLSARGFMTTDNSGGANFEPTVVLTSGVLITATRGGNTNNCTASWQLLEWY